MNIRFTLILMLITSILSAQSTPFNKGINLTNWFQVGSAAQIQFSKYSKQDFENIQSLGCDVIRLPINLHFMTNGAPDYILDPLFLSFLDQTVDWAEELDMHLILDNHSFDPAESTDPNIAIVLEKVWVQMAAHFKERSDKIYYEVLNEPHGITDAAWNAIQQDIVTAIRTVDDQHTIIIGGAGWNSFYNLDAMPVYEDDNLIYTFHFYDPFLFTHQGASWVGPSMENVSGIPFPYDAAAMPTLSSEYNGTWIQDVYNGYSNIGTIAKIEELIDIAIAFRDERNVPVYCGEFGVYIPNSEQSDRVQWYEAVRTYLEANNIGWTMWDYEGGFGIYNENGNGLFEHDINVEIAEAVGFTPPPQLPFIIEPDTFGRSIYSDFIGDGIVSTNSAPAEQLSFYSTDAPNNGTYCIRWNSPNQYNVIGFDFQPNRDFSYLEANGFALDFMTRSDVPNARYDVRFIDTDLNNGDHPWRIRVTIDNSLMMGDSYWHHVFLPLSDFVEHGSWDENTWWSPIGDFDWSAIDVFEIVAEHSDLPNTNIWFDNIQITDQDTAMIYEMGPFIPTAISTIEDQLTLQIYPNPASEFFFVENKFGNKIEYELVDLNGKMLTKSHFYERLKINIAHLSNGIYALNFKDESGRESVRKIVKGN